jgi:hypothetical protein
MEIQKNVFSEGLSFFVLQNFHFLLGLGLKSKLAAIRMIDLPM